MRRLVMLAFAVVLVCGLVAAQGRARGQTQISPVVLKKVRIGGDTWELVAYGPAQASRPRPRCFAVGIALTRRSPIFFGNGTESCGLPFYSGQTDARGGKLWAVLGLAFPPNVVRVTLNWKEQGEEEEPLQLLTKEQAEKAHVKRFRWGYVKLIGDHCLKEITGYSARGGLVYRAVEGQGTPCNVEAVSVGR